MQVLGFLVSYKPAVREDLTTVSPALFSLEDSDIHPDSEYDTDIWLCTQPVLLTVCQYTDVSYRHRPFSCMQKLSIRADELGVAHSVISETKDRNCGKFRGLRFNGYDKHLHEHKQGGKPCLQSEVSRAQIPPWPLSVLKARSDFSKGQYVGPLQGATIDFDESVLSLMMCLCPVIVQSFVDIF